MNYTFKPQNFTVLTNVGRSKYTTDCSCRCSDRALMYCISIFNFSSTFSSVVTYRRQQQTKPQRLKSVCMLSLYIMTSLRDITTDLWLTISGFPLLGQLEAPQSPPSPSPNVTPGVAKWKEARFEINCCKYKSWHKTVLPSNGDI